MIRLTRPLLRASTCALLALSPLLAPPAHAQFGWMQKAAGSLNPRIAKLNEFSRLYAMRDFNAAATIAEALVEDDRKAGSGMLGMLNQNNSQLQQSTGMAAQAQEGAGNYRRALELRQMQIDAVPDMLKRSMPFALVAPKLELARLYTLLQQPDAARHIYQDLLNSPAQPGGMEQEIHSRYGLLALQQHDWATAEQQLLLALDRPSPFGQSGQGHLEGLASIMGMAQEMAASLNEGRSTSDANGQVLQDASGAVLKPDVMAQQDPVLGLAELYWRTGRRDELAKLYQGRFRSHVENSQGRVPAAMAGAGGAQRKLELQQARMATLLAGAGLPELATQALDAALQMNATRLQAQQRNFLPEVLSSSMRARREMLDLALSLQLGLPQPAAKDITEVIGLLLQSKALHSELLAERAHAAAQSPDKEVQRLWTRLNSVQGQEPAAMTERGELSVQLRAKLGPQLRLAELGQGAAFLRALGPQLQQASLVALHVYTPYDFTRQESTAPHYLGVLVSATDLKFADLGEVSAIDRQVSALRADLTTPPKAGARPAVPAAARKLYEQLLQPLFGKQVAAGSYLADLDGSLSLLPLDALADANGHYLIDGSTWRYLSSARTLLRQPRAGGGDGRALILAHPSFDGPAAANAPATASPLAPALRSLRFAPLPETLDEGRAVAAALGRSGAAVDLLSGAQASAERLRSSHGPRYLHIASHGFFLEEAGTDTRQLKGNDGKSYSDSSYDSGLSSGIALAGANGSPNGAGILLASQLRLLDLHGTELAVLSACETGIGSPRVGESMESLRQALEVAGAQSTVASLWRVASAETRDTMAAFYDKLGPGRSKAAALRQAKLAIKNKQAHPFYWAPFTLTGAD